MELILQRNLKSLSQKYEVRIYMIQTVTGPIKKVDFGTVLIHEHISCSSLSFNEAFGKKWLDKTQIKTLACETLKQTKQKYNLTLMVDGTPIDLGRDVTLLKEVSEFSGCKIVASTGFYYLQSVEAFNNNAEEIAKWLYYECKNGICGTDIKPGILKCATGNWGITEDNLKKLSAVGTVQKETDLPLYVHCEHKEDIAFKQLDVLLENGANTEKIIIGHAAIRPDANYLESILKKGCYICMDQCHCYPHNLNAITEALIKLCQRGYTDKLLISNDYCIHNDFCNRNINGLHLNAAQHTEGLGYVFSKLYKEYVALCGAEEEWETMVCKNPINVLDV